MTRKDWRDLALHFAAGAGIALALLAFFAAPHGRAHLGLWAAATLWETTLVSWTREGEQARAKRMPGVHPSDVRHWSAHRWREFLAFPAGALLVIIIVAAVV